MSRDAERPGSERRQRRDHGGDPIDTPPALVKLPELIVIPKGTKQAMCGCGMPFYFAKNARGTMTSVSVAAGFISRRNRQYISVPGVCAPTAERDGLGFDHHIDCVQREQHQRFERKRDMKAKLEPPVPTPSADELAAKIRAAEQIAERHGIRCTGGRSGDECTGWAIIALCLAKKLYATPCSVHADQCVEIANLEGKTRYLTSHVLNEFLPVEPNDTELLSDRGRAIVAAFKDKHAKVYAWHKGRPVSTSGVEGIR